MPNGDLREFVRKESEGPTRIRFSAGRGQYGFVQALIREVAYNTLSKRDRKARHVAAARYYEQQESDELASVLAGHYLAAHENAAVRPETRSF